MIVFYENGVLREYLLAPLTVHFLYKCFESSVIFSVEEKCGDSCLL